MVLMKASKPSFDLIQVYFVCLIYIISSEIQREMEASFKYLKCTYYRDSNLRMWVRKSFKWSLKRLK